MDTLIRQIETVRTKLDGWRKLEWKEAQTRVTVIDPLLEALGWDVRDPDEVQHEYPTIDGKSVDYALMIGGKATLLVEAKTLDDSLTDVKAITQVVGYAANAGIAWCVLTNGIKWRVYRSIEKCAAPEKLMFEVSLDPRESKEMTVPQIAEQMWRFSREEMAKGTLDTLGERTFTDGKVRKLLDALMINPPRPVLNLIKMAGKDENLTAQKIRESLSRIWAGIAGLPLASTGLDSGKAVGAVISREKRKQGRGDRKATRKGGENDESIHTQGKPREIIELLRSVERFCYSLSPGTVERRCLRRYLNYLINGKVFCSVVVWRNSVSIFLKLEYKRVSSPPDFARDVRSVGHWGVGDFEMAIRNMSQFERAKNFIHQSFESVL